MSAFKELIRNDIKNVFMNLEEFAEKHNVNGKEMDIMIDNNELVERQKRIQSNMDGIYTKQILIYVSAIQYGSLPGIGKPIIIDGQMFRVTESINEGGIYSLHLEANRS